MKQIKILLILLWLLMILSPHFIWGSTTGKIAGLITDKATGDPLPGASVVIEGTTLGAASDLDGHYTILQVPPGTYNVQVSYVGYRKVLINDVVVNIDQTTRLDVQLETEVIEVGELVVTAQRNLIKPDVATSVVSINSDELKDLPIANVEEALGMQAGIGYDKGKLYIRGSGADQALFMVDGVTMRDPRNNQALTRVPLSAVKDVSVERGGFNAEYGQVQSGIINVVTNEGKKDRYSGNIIFRFTPPEPKYYRGNGIPDIHDPDSYWMRSYLDPAVCWTGTNTPESEGGWDEYTRNKYPSFVGWNAISEQLNSDNNPNNDLTPEGAQRAFMYETRKRQPNNEPDYEIDGGFGGPVPFISNQLGNLRFYTSYRRNREMLLYPTTRPDYVDYDWRLVLNSDINKSMRLRVLGMMGNVYTMEDNWNKGFYPHYPSDLAGGTGGNPLFNMFSDWTYSLTDLDYQSMSVKLTHNLNTNTFYEVSLEYIERGYNSRPPATRDNSQLFEVIPGFYETSNPLGYDPNANSSDGIIIWAGEQQSLARDFSKSKATTLKADLTSQINFNNLFKSGIEFVYNDLNLDYGFIQMQTGGQSYNSRVQMHNFPIRGAAYVQDKLETKGFTFNGGLRLDYSNAETDWWDYGSYDVFFISNNYDPNAPMNKKRSEGQWQLSPRLGISHPITENSKLFFNYGHFKQMPQYEALLRYDRRTDHSLARIGDPNLILAKTISYELGFDYLFPEDILLQVNAFYRDITDQQNQTTYYPRFGNSYSLSTSNNYNDIRGFEITLRKSAGRWFSGFANYTYQATSSGHFGIAQMYQDPKLQQDYIDNTENIYQARSIPSPNAAANLNFYTPDDFGPEVLGNKIFSSLLLNVLVNWSQGGYTTYNPKNISGIENNVQYVDYFDAKIRIAKTILISDFSVQFYADVSNLFNTLRMWNTGDVDYRRSLHLPENKGYDNIPGEDKFGDYRNPGVDWQPMEYQAVIDRSKEAGSTLAIYYEGTTGTYWQYSGDQNVPVDERWLQVSQSRIDQINKDKAYINMPGASTFWFLNPRTITFGLRFTFNID